MSSVGEGHDESEAVVLLGGTGLEGGARSELVKILNCQRICGDELVFLFSGGGWTNVESYMDHYSCWAR